MKTLLIIANPRSGKGRSLKVAEDFGKVASHSGYNPIIINDLGITNMKVSLERAIESDSQNIAGLISVGGDGLLHTLLPVISRYQLPFTVIPTGTGNDFAREIGVMKKTHKNILERLQQSPHNIDSLLIRSNSAEERACQVLSLGFDALVNERANRFSRVPGKLKYVIATIAELPLFKPLDFQITIDGVDSLESEYLGVNSSLSKSL
jgi:diacylglycerol kinase (ATP)